MHARDLIAVVGIVVGSTTAVLVGYLHRSQMRQIELFKQDPTVGLKPPRHLLPSWRAGALLGWAGTIVPFLTLLPLLFSNQSATGLTVGLAALLAAGASVNLSINFMSPVISQLV